MEERTIQPVQKILAQHFPYVIKAPKFTAALFFGMEVESTADCGSESVSPCEVGSCGIRHLTSEAEKIALGQLDPAPGSSWERGAWPSSSWGSA
jgi:hypothetical protein